MKASRPPLSPQQVRVCELASRGLPDKAIAAELGLKTKDKVESQEICFVPNGDYAAFIEGYFREQGIPASAGKKSRNGVMKETKYPSQQREVIEKMRAEIDLIENQTKRKEKLLRVQQSKLDIGSSVAANEEINQMYLQAIEQKLAFLNNI